MLTREYIQDTLYKNIAHVTFTKKDGTQRVMECTLVPDLLPVREVKEDKEPHKVNTDILSVYDLEKHAWRSFRIDSVKDINVVS